MHRDLAIACTIAVLTVVLLMPREAIRAGETGVIAGRITDAENGEPLPGAPISLLGSNRGTVTDADGRYFLLHVHPGTYALAYSYVGYQRHEVTGVRIEGGQSLTMNVALRPTAYDADAVVVVVSRTDVGRAKMDVPSTVMIHSRENLREAPVATISEAIAQDPAVDETGRINGAHVSSTLLIVDGQVMVDQEQGRPLLDNINATMVEEIQVLIGTYSAEYGNGRAGAIIVTTRDAFQVDREDQPFWASAHGIYTPGHLTWFETPGPEPNGDSLAAAGTYTAYGPNSHEWRTLATNTALDSTQHYTTEKGRVVPILPWSRYPNPRGYSDEDLRRIWMYQHRVGVDSLGGRYPGETPEHILEASLGIPIHRVAGLVIAGRTTRKAWAQPFYEPAYVNRGVDLKLNLRPLGNLYVDLKYGLGRGTGHSPDSQEGLSPTRKYLLDDMTIADIRQDQWGIRAGYAPWSSTVIEVRASRLNYQQFYGETPPYEEPVPDRYRLLVPGHSMRSEFVDTVDVYWQGDPREGTVKDKTYRNYLLHAGFLSYQGEYIDFSNDPYFVVWITGKSSLNTVGATIVSQVATGHRLKIGARREVVWAGGSEVSGTVFERWDLGRRTAAYVTDHITSDGMIADVGLRMDSWSARPNWRMDATPTRRLWSPRIGISHPFSANSRIYYNYGHFYDTNAAVFHSTYLRSPRTVQYEVGIDRKFYDVAWLHVAAWNKKRDRGFGQTRVEYLDESGESAHETFTTNTLFSDTYGAWVRAEWATRFFRGFIYHNRSLATTEFFASRTIDLRPPPLSSGWRSAEELSREPDVSRTSMVLRWSTPLDLHTWSISPRLIGGWALTLSWDKTPSYKIRFDPGFGYVPAGKTNLWVRGRSLWHLRVEKAVALGNTRVTAFMDIRNVFNSRLLNRSYFSHDEWIAYVHSLHTDMEGTTLQGPPREGWATDPNGRVLPTGNDQAGDMPEYAVVPQFDRWALWLDPRYVRWGMRIDF